MPTRKSHLLRSRIGKICIAITGENATELVDKATLALDDSNFLEFRLDYLKQPQTALPLIQIFLAAHPNATAIATCRRVSDGGRFEGKLLQELDILLGAAAAGCQIVDLPLESAEALPPAQLERLRQSGAAILLSHHDFLATKNLEAIAARALAFQPDFIKVVPTAKHLADNLLLIEFLEKLADSTDVVAICMGEPGTISRVLGVRAGSAFTFAASGEGDETAPGQMTARALTDMYHIDEVDAATKVYGVAGDPVRHSLSPLMLNAALRKERMNAVYLALQTAKTSDLAKLIQGIPLHGLSVTMPLKQEILSLLAHTDPLTAKIGACNTLLRAEDGKLYGFNTDVAGVVRPLEKRISDLRGVKALVLGAGGAARAAVFGLRDKGADVLILNRTLETAAKLARQSGSKTLKREQILKTTFDVIINATSVGMNGGKSVSPLSGDELRTRLVFDLVYNPLETPLLRLARDQNIEIITGVEMFVQQGARQFEIWTGKPAPEEDMFRVVLHALRQARSREVLTKGTSKTSPPTPSVPGRRSTVDSAKDSSATSQTINRRRRAS